jgi:hypothetical protein
MEKQSLEFITGYIFSKIENQILNAHVNKVERINPPYVYVPKSWFGLRPIKSELENISLGTRAEIENALGELCQKYNTSHATYHFSFYTKADQQYILFIVEGFRMPAVKEMTVAEIEKELGYKIKIIGEH